MKHRGGFKGPFADLFRLFLEGYLAETKDDAMLEVIQPFFAFRILVVANPRFYPDDTPETKRRLLDFGHAVLETKRFQLESIPAYLGRS